MRSAHVIRVVLVHSDEALPGTVQRALAAERPPIEVVGAANWGARALELAQQMKPDVVLLEMGPGDAEHVAVVAKLCTSRARVLLLAAEPDPHASVRAVKAGARGVLRNDQAQAMLGKAVRKVLAGELWLDRAVTARIIDELVAAKTRPAHVIGALEKLTARELDVVRALLEHDGAASRDLAARLQVSEHTLRNHFTSIYRKLGVPNRVGLFAYVSRHCADVAG